MRLYSPRWASLPVSVVSNIVSRLPVRSAPHPHPLRRNVKPTIYLHQPDVSHPSSSSSPDQNPSPYDDISSFGIFLTRIKGCPWSRRLLMRAHMVLDRFDTPTQSIGGWKRSEVYSKFLNTYIDSIEKMKQMEVGQRGTKGEVQRRRVERKMQSILERQVEEGIELTATVFEDLLRVLINMPGMAKPIVDKVLERLGEAPGHLTLLRMIADEPKSQADMKSLIQQTMSPRGKEWSGEAWDIFQFSQIQRGNLSAAFDTLHEYRSSPHPEPDILVQMANRILYSWMERRPNARHGDRDFPNKVAEALSEHFGGIEELPREFVTIWTRAERLSRNHEKADKLDHLLLSKRRLTLKKHPRSAVACGAYLEQLRFTADGTTTAYEAARDVFALVPPPHQHTPSLLNSLLRLTLHSTDRPVSSTELPLVLTILRLFQDHLVPAKCNFATIDTTVTGLIKIWRLTSYNTQLDLFPRELRDEAKRCGSGNQSTSKRWRMKSRISPQEWQLFTKVLDSIEREQQPSTITSSIKQLPMSDREARITSSSHTLPSSVNQSFKRNKLQDHPTLNEYITVRCTPSKLPLEPLMVLVERWIKAFMRASSTTTSTPYGTDEDLEKDFAETMMSVREGIGLPIGKKALRIMRRAQAASKVKVKSRFKKSKAVVTARDRSGTKSELATAALVTVVSDEAKGMTKSEEHK
ncbi:hypothetical protein BCR39DRAFT_525666 [Naematelia encephala]|uniref:Uncharacterized protein n=1 Tax=Naematelia encephala TaxID=71784 RepID=A0A1Y2BAG7_9TREE|nr:hypothetical protein BCR39DRAFT_525666 [Naematelia encephala]